jgi:subtilase family serine protease
VRLLRATLFVVLALPVGAAHAASPFQPGAHGYGHQKVCKAVPSRKAHCNAEVIVDAGGEPLVTPAPSGYGPSDLLSAYGLTTQAASSGASQTIAIVDAYDHPNVEADLGVYRSQYGLSPCTTANGCFRKVDQRGGTAYPSANGGWAQEISLDVDMASAICPNCKILLVEADSNSFTDLVAAVDRAAILGATQISNSYGGNEYSGETTDESHYNHPGIAVTVSTGDAGYGVEFPSSSRYVTAVGGTNLQLNAGTTRGWSETAWSGAGSGCSAYEPKPAWQTDGGCVRRTAADVSAVADPNTGVAVYDSFAYKGSSGWMVFGGTSAASPIIAGFDALVGSAAATLSYPYDNASSFNDVTSGSNGNCGGSYLCTAKPGYDGPTGVGTPEGGSPAVAKPTVTTQAAGSVVATTATVNGSVNPNGTATT